MENFISYLVSRGNVSDAHHFGRWIEMDQFCHFLYDITICMGLFTHGEEVRGSVTKCGDTRYTRFMVLDKQWGENH